MSGLEILAIGASVAGTALSATGQIMAGREQARAAEFERQQYQISEEQNRTAAIQSEARRTDEMVSSMETIQALRAGRGVGAFSPTGRAILTSVQDDTAGEILTDKSNYLTKADLSRRAADMSARRGRTSLLAGYLGAGATAFSGGSKIASTYAYRA